VASVRVNPFETQARQRRSMIGMTRARQEVEDNADYPQRMVANLLAVGFMAFLILSGYWVVATLAG
jgi:hypothetical protein